MKLMTTLATVALLWAGAVKANDFATAIEQAYAAAGYSNIVVSHENGDWLVTADLSGVTKTFLVNAETGSSTAVDPTLPVATADGASQDAGDDNGTEVADTAGDDSGTDASTGTEAGDDNGGGSGNDDTGGSDD